MSHAIAANSLVLIDTAGSYEFGQGMAYLSLWEKGESRQF